MRAGSRQAGPMGYYQRMPEAPALPPLMTHDEFVVWAATQDETQRYELVNGRVLAMAPERVQHAQLKYRATQALNDAVAARGLACEAFIDGPLVRSTTRSFQPDAMLRCGAPLPPDTITVPDPLVVVEVVSPSSTRTDRATKLEAYFAIPSVQHYLIVLTEPRAVIHHRRDGAAIATLILHDGVITLDPPGIEIAVAFLLG